MDAKAQKNALGGSSKFTYIGGPALFIEFGGLTFLTDPTFDPAGSEYTSGPVTLSKTMGSVCPVDSLGRHFSESRKDIARIFVKAGLESRLQWLRAGTASDLRV